MMSEELFEKIQNFEKKYADILVKWLILIKEQKINHSWRPRAKEDRDRFIDNRSRNIVTFDL